MTFTTAIGTFALSTKDGRSQTLLVLPLVLGGLGILLIEGTTALERSGEYIRDHLWIDSRARRRSLRMALIRGSTWRPTFVVAIMAGYPDTSSQAFFPARSSWSFQASQRLRSPPPITNTHQAAGYGRSGESISPRLWHSWHLACRRAVPEGGPVEPVALNPLGTAKRDNGDSGNPWVVS